MTEPPGALPHDTESAGSGRPRVVIYARISPTGSGERGTRNQIEICKPLAESLGEVTQIYVDQDKSATKGPRPEYQRMIDDLTAGRFDVIVAWHPDRLYRQPAELERLVTLVERHRILIRTVQVGELDLSTPGGRLVARLFGAYARFEVEHKVERHKLSLTANRTAGKWGGSKYRLFGFERDGTHHPDEAEIGRRMAKQALERVPLARIARELNAEGWRTTSGGLWNTRAVRDWLTNPKVAGLATLRGEIVGPGQWKPLVEPDKWYQIQATLKPSRPPAPRVALLSHRKIVCGECETGMRTATRQKSRVGPRGHARVYRCPTVEPYALGCGRVTIVAEPVEQLVEAYAQAKYDDPRFAEAVARRTTQGNEQARRLLAEVDELEAKRTLLEERLLTSSARATGAIVAAIEDAERRLAALHTQLRELPADGFVYAGQWPTDLRARSALVERAVDRVVISRAKMRGPRFDPDRVHIVPVTVD